MRGFEEDPKFWFSLYYSIIDAGVVILRSGEPRTSSLQSIQKNRHCTSKG
jgi:hypothetical protein